MPIRIKEIKAICKDHDLIRNILQSQNARFVGRDNQIDHYFKVPNGRLKIRVGDIEKNLIHYQRPNFDGPKLSKVKLYPVHNPDQLDSLLSEALETLVIVDKHREIYFIDNIKIHLDSVKLLGTFIEIEAIDESGCYTETELEQQCQHLMQVFKIKKCDLICNSYSDMLLKVKTSS